VVSFSGRLNGFGHQISGIKINDGDGLMYGGAGLFVNSTNATTMSIQNLGLSGDGLSLSRPASTTSIPTGLLIDVNYGFISNIYATAPVYSTGQTVGGLIGQNFGGLQYSYSTGKVGGSSYVGGLVGYQTYTQSQTSSSTGYINSSYYTNLNDGVLSQGSGIIGGLVGYLRTNGSTSCFSNCSAITSSYATGKVQGSTYIGGVVGQIYSNSSLATNTYAISGTYAANNLNNTAGSTTGGLVGGITYGAGSPAINFIDNYWNSTYYGGVGVGGGLATQPTGVTSLTNSQMQSSSSFTNGWFTTYGFGYVTGLNNGLPVITAITSISGQTTIPTPTPVSLTYIGVAGGAWSQATNWQITGTTTISSYAPTNANQAYVTDVIVNSGSIVNYDTATVSSIYLPISNDGTISFSGSSSVTLSGIISGGTTGALTQAQTSGTLTLSGANTYTGTTTVTSSILAAGVDGTGSSGAFGYGGSIVVNGGTLALGGYSQTAGTVTVGTSGRVGGGGIIKSNT
jgi:hypothetical protein